jgi:hypothetical protein
MGPGNVATMHLVAEALKIVNVDRRYSGGGPQWTTPARGIASKAFAAERAKLISMYRTLDSKSLPGVDPRPFESPDTTHFSIADKDGNVVANTYTLTASFGAHVVAPGTGFLLNNSLGNFDWSPTPVSIGNRIEPGKRAISTISPIIVFKDGKPTGLVDAGTYFHTDYSYLDDVARCTILHAQDVPPAPNGTTFANQAKAYADLPSGMKEKIKGLVVKHHYGNRDNLDKQSRSVASVLNAEQAQRVNWVRHPLVRPHPFTGQPALYAVSGSSFGIEGMPVDEALDLLRELATHATQDKYCYTNNYTHKYTYTDSNSNEYNYSNNNSNKYGYSNSNSNCYTYTDTRTWNKSNSNAYAIINSFG